MMEEVKGGRGLDSPEQVNNLQLEKYWTPARLELKAWFERNAASLGELYVGALRILHSPNFPGRTRFIGHAVREIRNRLPETITGVKSELFQWKNQLDGIVYDWRRAGFALDGSLPVSATTEVGTPSDDVPISRKLLQKISILLAEHAAARERPEETARRLFEGVDPRNQNARETLVPIVKQWLEVTTWFMAITHDSGRIDEAIGREELQGQFELFETILAALTREFFKTLGDLDEILEETNT
jgi:hypothetical protein